MRHALACLLFHIGLVCHAKEKDCLCLNVDCPGVIVGDEMTFVCQKYRDWFLWSFPPLEIIQKLFNSVESLELKVVPKPKEMWFSHPKDESSKHSWRHNPKEVLFKYEKWSHPLMGVGGGIHEQVGDYLHSHAPIDEEPFDTIIKNGTAPCPTLPVGDSFVLSSEEFLKTVLAKGPTLHANKTTLTDYFSRGDHWSRGDEQDGSDDEEDVKIMKIEKVSANQLRKWGQK